MTDNHRLSCMIENAKNDADHKILKSEKGNENDLHNLYMAEFLIKKGIHLKDKSIELTIENRILKSIIYVRDNDCEKAEMNLLELRELVEKYFHNAIESKGETL